jgi:hypothetical protein
MQTTGALDGSGDANIQKTIVHIGEHAQSQGEAPDGFFL